MDKHGTQPDRGRSPPVARLPSSSRSDRAELRSLRLRSQCADLPCVGSRIARADGARCSETLGVRATRLQRDPEGLGFASDYSTILGGRKTTVTASAIQWETPLLARCRSTPTSRLLINLQPVRA